MLELGHCLYAHEVGGQGPRFAVLDWSRPRAVGLLENTPWAVAGCFPTNLMLETAVQCLSQDGHSTAQGLALAVLQAIEEVMVRLAASPVSEEERWEAMWDFGGSAALVVAAHDSVAVARIGRFRVLRHRRDDAEVVFFEDTVIGRMRSEGREVPEHFPHRNIVTAALGTGAVRASPPERFVRVLSAGEHRFAIASPEVDFVPMAEVGSALQHANPSEAAASLAASLRRAAHHTLKENHDIAAAVVDLRP